MTKLLAECKFRSCGRIFFRLGSVLSFNGMSAYLVNLVVPVKALHTPKGFEVSKATFRGPYVSIP